MAALGPAVQATGKASPSRRVRIGLIGCGGRGRELVRVLQEFPDVEFPAVSDANEPRMQQAADAIARGPQGRAPEQVLEHERLLDRRDIDAVLIATTQHWHGRPFIQAAQAGKHIYVEKPLSHTIVEGRAMVTAAKKAGVVAMMGTQQRGYPHYPKAFAFVRSGRLGKISLVECWNYENSRRRVGRPANGDPPAGLHWDRWLGPAPLVPYNPARMNNSWWFDYAGGMMTNWAIHHIDIILWAMGVWSPQTAVCCGGKYVVDDLADTPDTIEASWEFPGFVMQYIYRGGSTFRTIPSRPYNHGICFHGTQATMVLDRSGYEIWNETDMSKSAEREANRRFWGDGKPGNEVDGPWQRLFVDCVKGEQKPPSDMEESHRATVCCHLANISYVTGRKLKWDGDREQIVGDPAAARLLDRPRRTGYELPAV
jgi:predicted dehydrogenase